jgi:EAL domain-containing protein (putative c-di-GMP-specific phosphodiesterase class I)
MGAVAEGVETLDHLRTVTLAGCDVQGFYFSKPVPAREVKTVLQQVPERLSSSGGLRPARKKRR